MSSPTPPQKDRKEIPNELRMVLAFVLMGLILVATPYVYKKIGIIPEGRPGEAGRADCPARCPAGAPARRRNAVGRCRRHRSHRSDRGCQ